MSEIYNKKISVVVCVYNGEKTLGECIQNILKQDYKNFELIIVDNNSSDDTKKIIYNFIAKDNRIIYVFEPKLSLGKARNTGIESCKNEIIAMTDSDCVVPHNWLSNLIKILEEEKENIVMGFQYDTIKNFWSKLVQKADEDYINKTRKGKYIDSFDPKNFIARANILKKIMFDSDQTYMEDFDFYLRSRNIVRIRFVPEIKVGHHNKSSLFKIIKVNFIRAYWLVPVYIKNKDEEKVKDIVMFTSRQTNKILFSPFLLVGLFFKTSPDLAFYKIISGISWMCGQTYWYIKNGKQ